jgi:GNAT superfamily N-acetyltransferase
MNDYGIAELRSSDIPLLDSIKPDEWPSIAEIHEHYLKTRSCACIKAINTDNEILGIGTGIVFEKTGWLAHIIVSKKYQGQGIGRSIVQNLISFLRNERGCNTVSLTATEEGYPVYKKAGFTEESMYRIMIKPQGYTASQGMSDKIHRSEPRQHAEMLNIDRLASGENREELLRNILADGYVYIDDGKILGFYLPRFGESGVTAITEEAGIGLLQERMKEDKRIVLPEENRIAYEYLRNKGYTEFKKIHRMILGKTFERNPQYCYSRIGGFAG